MVSIANEKQENNGVDDKHSFKTESDIQQVMSCSQCNIKSKSQTLLINLLFRT